MPCVRGCLPGGGAGGLEAGEGTRDPGQHPTPPLERDAEGGSAKRGPAGGGDLGAGEEEAERGGAEAVEGLVDGLVAAGQARVVVLPQVLEDGLASSSSSSSSL